MLSDNYWSSTTNRYDASFALAIDIWSGWPETDIKTNYDFGNIWPVRGGVFFYNLSIFKSGSGSGAVSSSDSKIDCGSNCVNAYLNGTEVTLNAIPSSDSIFTSWSNGTICNINPCTLTITGNIDLIANFDIITTSTSIISTTTTIRSTTTTRPTTTTTLQISTSTSTSTSTSVLFTTSSTTTSTQLGTGNLTPYQPNGWSDKIVVSKIPGTNSDDINLTTADNIYVDWAVINYNAAKIMKPFYCELLLDNEHVSSWYFNSLAGMTYVTIEDYELGQLSLGIHTITLVADSTNTIAETDESDNTYKKTINIGSSTTTTAITTTSSTQSTTSSSTLSIITSTTTAQPATTTTQLTSSIRTTSISTSTTSTFRPTTTITTTSISNPITTTTTSINCPITNLLGNNNPELQKYRIFRDNKLAGTFIGRKIIALYYNNSDNINAAMDRSPMCRDFTRAVLKTISPLMTRKEE